MTATTITGETIDARKVAALTIGLALDCVRFGDRRQGDISKIESEADKSLLGLTKHLIPRRVSGERGKALPPAALKAAAAFRKIERLDLTTQDDLKRYGLPSMFKAGTHRIPLALIEEVEALLTQRAADRKPLVADFVAAYPGLIDSMEEPLGDQFNRNDFPPVEVVEARFSFSWRWFELDAVPDTLKRVSPDAWKAARKRIDETQRDMAEAVRNALRSEAADAVRTLTGKLAGPGSDPKAFRQTTILRDLTEFFRTFPLRNVTDDGELAKWVGDLRKMVDGLDLDDVKADAARQAALKGKLDGMLKRAPRLIELE